MLFKVLICTLFPSKGRLQCVWYWKFFEHFLKISAKLQQGAGDLWRTSAIFSYLQKGSGVCSRCSKMFGQLRWSLEVLENYPVTFDYLLNATGELHPSSKCLGLLSAVQSVFMSVLVLVLDIFVIVILICTVWCFKLLTGTEFFQVCYQTSNTI